MQQKIGEKQKAIELRKQGFSYKEILEQIPVAKSSLSLWLRSVGLSNKQKQRLTEKKLASALRGAKKRKEDRITISKNTKDIARREIGELTDRELWLIGVSLYWGEGSKEKSDRPGSGVKFSNSDPKMIKVFLKWLFDIILEKKENIYLEIYIHDNCRSRLKEVINYWSNQTGFSKDKFSRIYFKRNKINTKRKNIGQNYYGLLRVGVKSSSILQRKIEGWVEGIYKHCEIV